MRTRPLIKTLAIASATTLALGLTAAPSQAARTVVTTEEQPWTLFYDNVVTDADPNNTMILYTGASVGEECAGDLPTVKVRSRAKGEEGAAGATLVERFVTRATFYVYEGNDLDAVEFFDQVCASLSTGGEAPTPIATGRGLVKRRVDVAYNGAAGAPDVTDVNSAVGVVRTTDGQRWAVRGEAELTLSPDFSVDHVSFDIRNRR